MTVERIGMTVGEIGMTKKLEHLGRVSYCYLPQDGVCFRNYCAPTTVIPSKAGIQRRYHLLQVTKPSSIDSGLRRNDGEYDRKS